jgi:hypothetical protein
VKREAQAKAPKPAPLPPFSLKAAINTQMAAATAALALPDGAAAVHETRIALKRLRVLARIADFAAQDGGAALELAAQAAMKRLAHARDLAALEHAARAIAEETKGDARQFLVRSASVFAWMRRLAEATALNEGAIAVVRLAPIAEAVPEITEDGARRAAKSLALRARRAFKTGAGSRAVSLRHDWRKREKDRRYGAALLASAWLGPHRRKTAGKLTEALGRERDCGLLIERLRADDRTPAKALKCAKRHRRALARTADRLGAKLHKS